ncbi:MAG TPA: SprB repeat-containing protein, partial [Flavobacteriales bacterium]|nr:SprB repeat-containing protein [Flavobacteriales bacterium]
GNYDLTVTDANGCVANTGTSIVAPPLLGNSTTTLLYPGGTQISCAAQSDGAIDLTISGGVAPYSIAWTDGLGFNSNSEDISGLQPGGYQATITDVNGCTSSAFVSLTAPAPLDLTASLSIMNGSNVSCAGVSDGSIDLTLAGGTAPYAFAWSNGSQTEDLSNLAAGAYTVNAVDANGCMVSATYTLVAPQTFTINLALSQQPGGTNILCNGASDGSIDATIAGGTMPFALAWSGPNGFTSTASNIASLVAGEYSLQVTDANGCAAIINTTLTEPAPVIVDLTMASFNGNYNIPCAGLNIGSATASASGGTPNYDYAWVGPNSFTSTDANIFSLFAGAYTVTATDNNGCTGSASVTLTEPQVLDVTPDIPSFGAYQVTCAGNDGSASLNIVGGTLPYFIGWTGPNGFTSTQPSISGLGVGDYTITVIDANGCVDDQPFTLTAPPAIDAQFASTANICSNDAAGTIDVTATGGVGNYTYQWIGPNVFTSTNEDLNALA